MIERIVKMTFRPEECHAFSEMFERYRSRISSAPGCLKLRLLRDADRPHIFFTHSEWENPESLEAYRKSELFAEVWPQTKALFAEKPEAWTVRIEG